MRLICASACSAPKPLPPRPGHRAARGRVALVDRLGQLRVVQRRAVLPQRRGDRGAERAGGDAHEVRQARRPPACGRASGPRSVIVMQRDEEERHRRALHAPSGSGCVAKSACVLKLRAHPQHQREDRGRRRSRSRRGSILRDVLADPAATARSPAGRPAPSTMPAQRRGVAHVLLQPQRQQHDVAEEQAVGRPTARACPTRKLRRANRRRSTTGCFSVSSQARKNSEADHRDDRQRDDLRSSRTSRAPCPCRA